MSWKTTTKRNNNNNVKWLLFRYNGERIMSQEPKSIILMSMRLTLFRMGIFGAAHGWGEQKSPLPLPKICRTYHAMVKLGTVIPYIKKIKKNMNLVTHPFSSADISTFSPEVSKVCHIKKYRYRLHFDR